MKKLIIFCILSLLMSGCGAKGIKFQSIASPEEGNSVIYIMRNHVAMDGSAPKLIVDDLPDYSFPQRQFFRYETNPGVHKIRVDKSPFFKHGPFDMEIELASNEIKYVIFFFRRDTKASALNALFGPLEPVRSKSKFILMEIKDEARAKQFLRHSKGIELIK